MKEQAATFLEALTGEKNPTVTFQTFDDNKERKDRFLAVHIHGKLPGDINQQLKYKQRKGAGVFVMVNVGDGKGRKAENAVSVRAVFLDTDGAPMEPARTMLKPHIIVESSPGKYHLYWKVSDCPLDQFPATQKAIAAKFGGDPSVHDLSRVMRLPGFLHQKGMPVMTRLIAADHFPPYSVAAVFSGLGLNLEPPVMEKPLHAWEIADSATGEVINLTTWAAQNPGFDIVAAVGAPYRRGNPNDGKQHIVCPFEDQHTDQGDDRATFVANASPQFSAWDIHCCHAHCAGRDRLEYLLPMLVKGWLTIDQLQTSTPAPAALEKRRPPKIYYPVNNILAAPEWSTLLPDERRIALDLMRMAWAEEDGMIGDDDWKIARYLGMPENEWLQYRATLSRAGWLIESNGRLTNTIVKREFDLAQKAYMDAIIGGQRGGKIAAAHRRGSSPPSPPLDSF